MSGQQTRSSNNSKTSNSGKGNLKNGGFATSEKDARHASGPSAGAKVERMQAGDEDVGSPPYADGNDAGPQVKQEDGGGVDQRTQGSHQQSRQADRGGSHPKGASDAGQGRSHTEREGSSSRNGRGERTRDDAHGSARHRGIH